MLADPFFWYGLALKVAMTATIVIVASMAAERSGPFLAALIAALPTAAGAAYIILALEHPPAFIAQGVVLSIGAATLVWFAAAALLQSIEWTPWSALAVNAVVFACTIPLSARYRAAVPSERATISRCAPRRWPWSSRSSRLQAIGSARSPPACSPCSQS